MEIGNCGGRENEKRIWDGVGVRGLGGMGVLGC